MRDETKVFISQEALEGGSITNKVPSAVPASRCQESNPSEVPK